jgi:hypothetical protein
VIIVATFAPQRVAAVAFGDPVDRFLRLNVPEALRAPGRICGEILYIDSFGNLYVVDSSNARVQKLNSSGEYLLQWGSRGSEVGQFNEPLDIVLDGQGTSTSATVQRPRQFGNAPGTASIRRRRHRWQRDRSRSLRSTPADAGLPAPGAGGTLPT